MRARTPHVSKFRDYPFDLSDDERRDRYVELVAASGRSRAANVEAFFRATFDVWYDRRSSGREEWYVGYSPILVVDAETILDELPGRPFRPRRAEPVVGLRGHEEAAGAALARRVHARLDDQPAARVERARALSGPPARPSHRGRARGRVFELCEQLGLERADTLARPSWNGEELAEVYPWGTIRKATPETNRATAEELSDEERDEVRRRAGLYLEKLGYDDFL